MVLASCCTKVAGFTKGSGSMGGERDRGMKSIRMEMFIKASFKGEGRSERVLGNGKKLERFMKVIGIRG